MISIKYLEHADGRVFEVGKLWPGDAPAPEGREHEERAVGPIFLLPETVETVEYESDGEDDEDDDGDVITKPACYEVWCVSKAEYLAFFGAFKPEGAAIDKRTLMERMATTTTIRYVIHVDRVVGFYEEWPTLVAYEAMMDRAKQSEDAAPREQPTNGAQAASPSP